jgi:phosphatidate cytidylyltransferase
MTNNILKRFISSVILIPISIYIIVLGDFFFNLLLLILLLISLYEWINMSKRFKYLIPGIFFLIYSFYSAYKLRYLNNINYNEFLFVITICVLSDIGGFCFGKIFKGPKLTKYSPNKTFSGMIGSFIFPIIFFFFYSDYYQLLISSKIIFILILIISLTSQIGDIIISFFKRKANLKDTGNIIPGHGGILDRIDGMIFAVPFFYKLLFFIQ